MLCQPNHDLSESDTEPIPSKWLADEFDDTSDLKLGKALKSMISPDAEYAEFWGDDDKPSKKQKTYEESPPAWRRTIAFAWFQRMKTESIDSADSAAVK
jgi:hypothetical protein